MAYTVLARKYRSSTFDDLIGQDHVARTLKKAITSDRIAHAFLFTGTRGTGKTSSARILAKCLNCDAFDQPTPTPCGKCVSCISIARGDDIDVIEIDAASNTQVEKTRDIIENAQYRPARSRFKIYIIDEVHMLSKASFNALLKTLEEPPEHVKFILATTESEKVLPTILSRCQRYDFRNIPTREIAGHLKDVCEKEGIAADADALLLVAKAGAGSMRDALSLLDRLLSAGESTLNVELIEQMLGLPKTQLIFDLAQFIGTGDVAGTLTLADKLITQGLSPETLVASLTDHLRNLMVLRACGPETGLVEVPGLPLEDLVTQAGRFDTLILGQDVVLLEELRRQLRTSAAGRALVDATLVRLALAEQFTSIEDLIGVVNGNAPGAAQKKKPEPGRVEPQRVEPRAPVEGPRTVLESPPLPGVGTTSTSTEESVEPQPSSDESDDALPAVGKVADAGATTSMWQAFKKAVPNSADAPAKPPAPRPAPSNIEPVPDGDLARLTARLLATLSADHPHIVGFLDGGRVVTLDEHHATLRYPADLAQSVRMLERNGKKETLQDVLSRLLDRPIGVKFELAPAEELVLDTDVPLQEVVAAVVVPPPRAAPIDHNVPITEELLIELRQNNPLLRAVEDLLGGAVKKVEEP